MLMFISAVMNMGNGRCEMTFCRLSPDFFNIFAFLSPSSCPMIIWLLCSQQHCFGKKKGGVGVCLKMPLHVDATVYGRAALCKIAGGARGGTA